MHRRAFVLGAIGFTLVGSCQASAAGIRPFDKNAFTAAQEAGQSIVVFVHASW